MHSSSTLYSLHTDPRLTQLETLLRRPQPFNILSALGMRRQELRHSDLLAYLLHPRQPHKLGNQFVRLLLQRVAPLLPEHLDVASLRLDAITVQREWHFIDILIESAVDQLAIIIENKVDSTEHSNQLGRYYQLVRKRRPNWRIIGVYLTLDGTPPTTAADRTHYTALSYSDITEMLGALAAVPEIDPDVETLVRHYAEQIRSDLVPDQNNDAAHVARELYVDHHAAIDAIIRARDARQTMVQQCFDRLFDTTIREYPDLLQRDSYYTSASNHRWHTRFAPPEWYRPDLQVAQRWTNSKLMVMFQFAHEPERIWIDLAVAPTSGAEPLRHALYELAAQERPPFFRWHNDVHNDWFSIYGRWILTKDTNFFTTYDDESIRRAITEHWTDFIQRDLPMIRATIRHEILGKSWNAQ